MSLGWRSSTDCSCSCEGDGWGGEGEKGSGFVQVKEDVGESEVNDNGTSGGELGCVDVVEPRGVLGQDDGVRDVMLK